MRSRQHRRSVRAMWVGWVAVAAMLAACTTTPPSSGPDVTPPVLTLPAAMMRGAPSGDGAVVTFEATAKDKRSGVVPVTCEPASGSLFPIGTTSVSCQAVDTAGNVASGSFDVTVVVDADPPVVTVPASISRPALDASGANVTFVASALDAIDGAVPVTCTPPSGSLFALGATVVDCEAADSAGNVGSAAFTVTVVDSAAPLLDLPAPMSVPGTSAGATVTYEVSAEDAVDGAVPVTCAPPSGSTFALGLTTVSCTAADAAGNTASGTFGVTVVAAPLTGVTSLGSGIDHTCAVMADTSVRCWGRNDYGQLGVGTTTNRSIPTPVPGLSDVVSVRGGALFSCALQAAGTVWCWGRNSDGQLGNGTTDNTTLPHLVMGINNAVDIELGARFACALLATGGVKCWGTGGFGALGNGQGTTSDRYFESIPVEVSGISDATSLAVGGWHACVVLASGGAKCWGQDTYGQLGDHPFIYGQPVWSNVPVDVALADVAAIRAGYDHTCATVASGSLYCWGENGFGQLGNGSTNPNGEINPQLVSDVPGIVELTLEGGSASCVRLADGRTRCWGWSFHGQLGTTTTVNKTPRTMSGYADAVQLSLGASHTCALMADTTVRCTGWNLYGELGDGTNVDRTSAQSVIAE